CEALLGDGEIVAEAAPVGVGEGPDHPALRGELLLVRREEISAVPPVGRACPPRQSIRAELLAESACLLVQHLAHTRVVTCRLRFSAHGRLDRIFALAAC